MSRLAPAANVSARQKRNLTRVLDRAARDVAVGEERELILLLFGHRRQREIGVGKIGSIGIPGRRSSRYFRRSSPPCKGWTFSIGTEEENI